VLRPTGVGRIARQACGRGSVRIRGRRAATHRPGGCVCARMPRPLRGSLPSTASSSLSSISCERNRYEAWSPWTGTVCTFGCPAARRLATSRLPWAVVALVPFAVFTPLAVLDALAVMTTTLTGICCAEAALHTVAAIWSASPPACSEAISRMAWPEDVATACPSVTISLPPCRSKPAHRPAYRLIAA
jgi:hypothetical protein